MKIKKMEMITPRLLLRAFKLSDADRVRRLAGDKGIARTTLSIPYPYKKAWLKNG